MSRSAICLRSSVTSHINNKNDKRQHVMTSKDYMLLGANIRKRHEHDDDGDDDDDDRADGDDGSSNKHHIFLITIGNITAMPSFVNISIVVIATITSSNRYLSAC